MVSGLFSDTLSIMGLLITCDQCGVALADGRTCQDDFHQLLFWEGENPEFWQVHHLTVLCFHLQHPNLYSEEGLAGAKKLLVDFVEMGVSTDEIRKRDRQKLDSGSRDWNIKGDASSRGRYLHPVTWTITARDIVRGGKQHYVENVRKWAGSVVKSIRDSGNS